MFHTFFKSLGAVSHSRCQIGDMQ